ncbi:MAG: type II secretion system protein GspF [Candidatus Abyssobacteria bacterium SURF_17]|uniref:General secretion pathway protein F n=1 Tax=Candidatus Abyssobacteria bacterium SURF_17 TaxID=2093361 RepID=A0A419EN23_9BACT|nr:MAG: type II secretion system protein GspF [Candidatus Abyssubacteria bacterium SURF_17]
MPVFEYVAINTASKRVKGVLDAESAQVARSRLREMGLLPVQVGEVTPAAKPAREITLSDFFARPKTFDIAMFTRQLAVLLQAGMPLVDALNAVLEQIDSKGLVRTVYDIKETISEGASLSAALAQHRRAFPQLYVNMVKAGESSGALEVVLFRLADYMEKQLALRRRVTSALLYPCLMVMVGVGVVLFLLTYIIPTITKIFMQVNRALPTPTVILINVSTFLREYWLLMFASLAIVLLLLNRYLKTEAGGAAWDKMKLRLPIFGKLNRKMAVARFARTLGTLTKSGVGLMDSLDIVRNIVNNRIIAGAIEQAQESVRKGDDLATSLKRSAAFPPVVTHMIALGERSGQLEDMLIKVADTFDDEVDTTLAGIVSLLEPAMIVIMAVVVGFIVLAVLLPIFDINQMVQ